MCDAPCELGAFICPECGEILNLVETPQTSRGQQYQRLLPVVGVEHRLGYTGPTITLHIVKVNDLEMEEEGLAAIIPVERLESPVQIGRCDLSHSPPIIPDLDLIGVLQTYGCQKFSFISRRHADLRLEQGQLVIKHLSPKNNSTWIRCSGDDRLSSVPVDCTGHLLHGDVILLGDPVGLCIQLRVVLSHP